MAISAVTFDVYAALFDTVSHLTTTMAEFFRRREVVGDAAAAGRIWRERHREYLLIATSLERDPASNRAAIEASARTALRHVTPPPSAEELQGLIAAWESLPAWPEAVPVLRAVRARALRLAALSNGDEAMLRRLLATLPVPFDAIVSTEGGRFKPHRWIYEKTLRTLRVRSDELLHVAGSATDAMGATAFGLRTIWVNRHGDPLLDVRFAPAYEVTDLTKVLEILDAL